MKKNNLELRDGSTESIGVGAKLGAIKGNPDFQDQFNLNFRVIYVNDTLGTIITPAALPAALQNQLPVFLFGNSDYTGAYNRTRQYFPLNTWVATSLAAAGFYYGIANKEVLFTTAVGAIFNPFVRDGDFYLLYRATVAGSNYLALVIVNCPQVPYGSLLDSINSDVFLINMIRYTVPAANVNQLRNQILIINKSIFGKTQDDKIDPQTFVTGTTFNRNIADIPLNMEINKYKSIGFYINFDCVDFGWSVTVKETRKITL